MPDQLSLFPPEFDERDEKPSSGGSDQQVDLPPVDEVFETGCSHRQPEDYLALLDFINRFPHYSPLNGFLLYIQNPSATRVATAATWMKKFNRRPNADARPMIILAPMSPVVFVYDIAETKGDPPRAGSSVTTAPLSSWHNKVYEHTIANGVLHGIEVRETSPLDRYSPAVMPLTGSVREKYRALDISPVARYLILVDREKTVEDRYAALVHDLGRIFCGHLGIDAHAWWPDRRGGSLAAESIEAESVAYLVCGRKGVEPIDADGLFSSPNGEQKLPRFSLHTILQVVGYIEEMGKALWKEPKKKSRYR